MKRSKQNILTIDKDQLDEEWVNHVELVDYWAREGARVKRELMEAKSRLEVTKAELFHQVATDPEKYGIEKVSNPAINAVVARKVAKHKDTKTYHDAEHACDIVQGANRTLDHRKSALQDLVRLFLADYFSPMGMSNEGGPEMKTKSALNKVRRAKKKREADDA